MRVVLDTNVVVSAAVNPKGPPAEIIRAWRARSFEWVTSPPLLLELARILHSPRVRRYMAWREDEVDEFVVVARERAEVVTPAHQIEAIPDDPSDNRLLEAAVAAGADYVISGDQHLLQLKTYEGVQIVTPARFVAILVAGSR
jgi:putative PIN family toxin of toxin-antitoxin system